MVVNHKRVSRIMREDNLLAMRYRKFILTTDSRHDYQVYLNLAARMTVTGINQLWVADITYIRLRVEFVFLAVVHRSLLAQGDRLGAGSDVGGASGGQRRSNRRSSDGNRRREWSITPIRVSSMPARSTERC